MHVQNSLKRLQMIQNVKKKKNLKGGPKKRKKVGLRKNSFHLVGNSRKMYPFSRKRVANHAGWENLATFV